MEEPTEDPDTPVDPEDPDTPVDPDDPDTPVDPEDPEELLAYLSEVGHPVLGMEPFDM